MLSAAEKIIYRENHFHTIMNETKTLEQIANYLEGTLPDNEMREFEERLKIEPTLKEALQNVIILKEGIRQAAREQMRTKLQNIEKKLSANENSNSTFQIYWLKVAASIALVVVAAWLLWPSETVSTEELFAENFEPYPNIIIPTVRGSQTTDSSMLAQAYRAYDLQDYNRTIKIFENISPKDEDILLYLGNSYLAKGSPEKAIPVFEKMTKDFDTFDEQAEWYLSLSYLANKNEIKAKSLLKTIIDKGGSYKTKAEKVMQKLNP